MRWQLGRQTAKKGFTAVLGFGRQSFGPALLAASRSLRRNQATPPSPPLISASAGAAGVIWLIGNLE